MPSTICLGCGAPTLNGSRCPTCAGGYRQAHGGNPYALASYQRMRTQRLQEQRRTFGPRCPRCGRPEVRSVRASWLTLNHTDPLGRNPTPEAVMGPTEVMCLSCNDRQQHVDRPRRRYRRAS